MKGQASRFGVGEDAGEGGMGSEWQEQTWGDLATLEYGKALCGYQDTEGSYRVYGTNGPIGWHDEPLYPHPGVIIGRKGAYRGIHFSSEPFFAIDTAFYLKPKCEFDIKWAYYELLTHDINSMDYGLAIPSTSRDFFYKLLILIPSASAIESFTSAVAPLFARIKDNQSESRSIAAIRNALLPKLMSGEIRVEIPKN